MQFLSDEAILRASLGESSQADFDDDNGETVVPPPTNQQAKEATNFLCIWRVVKMCISHYLNVFTN